MPSVTQPAHNRAELSDADYRDDMRFLADYIKDVSINYDFFDASDLKDDDINIFLWRAFEPRVRELKRLLNTVEWL